MDYPRTLKTRNAIVEDSLALEYLLLGDLRDTLEEPLDSVNLIWLRAVVDALVETLSHNFALQDEGGYLQEVVDCDPNWFGYVRKLSDERSRIYDKLRILRRELGNTPFRDGSADGLRTELRDWMIALTAFQRHERRLLQTAFTLDVGTGG